MNKVIYFLFIGLFLVNCTSNTIIKKPDDLIPKEQMVDLLTDLFLASGGKNIKNTQQKRNVDYYPLVYQKHQIDSTRFKESNYYYTSRIDEYDEILKKVDERLKKLRKHYEDERKLQDSLKKGERKLQDSLKLIERKLIKPKFDSRDTVR